MKKARVRLGKRSYTLLIGSGLLKQTGLLLQELGFSDKAIIITNPSLRRLHGKTLLQGLTDCSFKVSILEVPDGEEQKSLETAGRLYRELTNCFVERTTPILALGGGVIGDLSGFVAATYLRGVPLVQIPTTLVAQVDSSIGGKVAVNHGQLKNKVGVFYQPKLVIADTATLKTLSGRALSDGLAETIKYGVIRDAEFFSYLERNIERINAFDERILETVVFCSAKIKGEVVAKDETDLGLRNILNYGHTIGHAIESVSNFRISHGQAIAIGMVAAAKISNRLGILPNADITRLKNLIARTGLPTEPPRLELASLTQAMKHDKKVLLGRIRFVLPKILGEVFITDEVPISLIEQVLLEE